MTAPLHGLQTRLCTQMVIVIFSCSATGVDVILQKIFQEFEAGEIVIIDMVVLSLSLVPKLPDLHMQEMGEPGN